MSAPVRIDLGVDEPAVIARPVRRRARVGAGLQESLLRSARHAPDVASPAPLATNAARCPSGDKTAAAGLSGGVVSPDLMVSFQVLHPQRGQALRVSTPEHDTLAIGASETPLA